MTKPDEYRAMLEFMTEDQAIDFVSGRVKEAIDDTRRTRSVAEATIAVIKVRR
jgi:hypothetical protein